MRGGRTYFFKRMAAMRLFRIILVGFILIFSAITVFAQIKTITVPITTEFGQYIPVIKPYIPAVPKYTVPDNLTGVLYADRYAFNDTIISKLISNGFATVMTNERTIPKIYLSTANSSLPVFVTCDAILQTLHVVYDNMLRIAEHENFYSQLDTILDAMILASNAIMPSITSDSLKIALQRTQAFLDVAHTLLTDSQSFKNDTIISTMVAGELVLIAGHAGFAFSKVLPDFNEDFSQYVPRGHYTRDSRFMQYFKAMMYLGRMNHRVSSTMETMQACILTRFLATAASGSASTAALWGSIYSSTAFFVGQSDDLNYQDYKTVLDRVLGAEWLTSDINLLFVNHDTIMKELGKLPSPMILSGDQDASTKGFRVMGQRFVPDSYVFSKMVYPSVSSRYFPRGLDIFASLGSPRAREILFNYHHDNALSGYTTQLDYFTAQFAAFSPSRWAENLYWNWLYSLVPLFDTTGTGYPFFMTTQAWAYKALTTASASWAELRHDAILYAKQSYGSVGVCHPSAGVPQGYVEPCPDLFGRLASLTAYMRNGLIAKGLSAILPIQKLIDLDSVCLTLQDIAVNELQGGNITSDQYLKIAVIGKTLEGIEDFANYQVPPAPNTKDTTMAIVADVHTDPNSGNVLEEGVGCPMYIYVVVPIEGRLQVCRGAMFSYYEFQRPMSNRLTDEQWQTLLATASAPAMPGWTSSFKAGMIKTSSSFLADETQRYSPNVAVSNTFRAGDSLVITIASYSTPSVDVQSGDKPLQTFYGISGTGGYRIVLPPESLADSMVMLTFISTVRVSTDMGCTQSIPLTYRKAIFRNDIVSSLRTQKIGIGLAKPVVCKNRILFPAGSSWRIFTTQGRLVAVVKMGERVWIAPKQLAQIPLIIAPTDQRYSRSIRLILGN